MLPGIELTNGIIGNLAGGVPLINKDGTIMGSIGGWQRTFCFLSCQAPSSCAGISGAMTAGTDEEVANAAAADIDRILGAL